VQANAYITPPQNQGFSDHYDVHDVFVLQLEGQKRWQIREPVLDAPLRDQPWSDRKAAVEARAAEPPLIEAVLSPGDCLYLPRGFLHSAQALGGTSIHLTIGIHTWTRHALAEHVTRQALAAIARTPELRRSLPLSVDVADAASLAPDAEVVREALLEAVRTLDVAELARAMAVDSRRAQRAAPVGPLRQLRTADELTEASSIRVREHLDATVEDDPDGGGVLKSRAGDLTLSPVEAPLVAALLETGVMDASHLGVTLSRRLVLAGVAVAG
jgi:ribosomal protein L16 Arg81 hydroxylase